MFNTQNDHFSRIFIEIGNQMQYRKKETNSNLYMEMKVFEPRHEISNNMVCATSKGSDQPAHTQNDTLLEITCRESFDYKQCSP